MKIPTNILYSIMGSKEGLEKVYKASDPSQLKNIIIN